ncbi:quaternary ammonium compound-resistance protein SugE [Halalkalibacter wakoensis JCM 9140]|uniref:Quaternary ammonium compound-resistance protein SugE n=1 Tax=Halalkalibacter wakoensis JCM 9140 TaxID=1236970 RepID=W4Q7V1_9BACI|nr:multidrug efflux SMR transporter [Halalkalibacter wakoensis]GAE28040.1 quaternary ammonium compound-resistance protein SugE [Halalkalibacter wakoensis JCM 9140]
MEWFYLILAGLFEMLGVAMITQLNRKKGWLQLILLISAFSLSFLFLSLAMSVLPMGIAYAVWTGIGAAGGVIIGMVFYRESKHWKRIFFLSLIVFAAVGLKLVT